MVNVEALSQIIALEENINKMAESQKNDWNALIEWDIPNSYESARQDAFINGVASQYTFEQLSASSGTTFNSPQFYDYNQYLSQLVLLAQIDVCNRLFFFLYILIIKQIFEIVDEEFQVSVQDIFEIDKETNTGIVSSAVFGKEDDEKKELRSGVVKYMRGPVKLMERARAKAQNDYAKEPYPASACVIDFNRCTLIFDDISSLLRGLKLFVNKVKYYQSGNIIDIARDKNGFIEYVKKAQYADVKLNVVIKGRHNSIIGEVQFLLRAMKEYKDKAHNLYAIQRKEEAMTESVSKIWPILLDQKKDIQGIACEGDVKKMCSLMILQNQSIKDVMFVGETGETVFANVCGGGHWKMLLFLESLMNRKEFVEHVLLANNYDVKPIEYAVNKSQFEVVKHLMEMKEIKEEYKDNDPMIFRLFIVLFTKNSDEHLANYVLSALKISKEKINYMFSYKCPKQSKAANNGAFKYHRMNIICRVIRKATFQHLKTLISVIGADVFATNMCNRDYYARDAMCYAIMDKKINIIEYMLSFEEVKERYLSDNEALYILLGTMYDSIKYTDTVQCVIQSLGLTKEKLEELYSMFTNVACISAILQMLE